MKSTTFSFWDWQSLGNKPNTGYYLERQSGVDVRLVSTPSHARSMLAEFAATKANDYHYGNSPFGRRVISESGEWLPEPPSIYVERRKRPNKDFKKRCKAGEIVVAPYYTGFGVISLEQNELVKSSTSVLTSTVDWAPVNVAGYNNFYGSAANLFTVEQKSGRALSPSGNNTSDLYFMTRQGFNCPRAGSNLLLVQYRGTVQDIDNLQAYSTTLDSTMEFIVENSKSYEIDSIMIQETLAKANSGDLDALTSIAEMPELIQSVIDSLKLMAKITSDARKKDFQVHQNSVARAKNSMRQLYNNYLKRKLKDIPPYGVWVKRKANRGLSLAAYHTWVNNRKASTLSYESYLKKKDSYYKAMIRKEYLDASAGVWLNYRYNIDTTRMMLEDIGEVLFNYGTEFFRYREKKIEENFIDWSAQFPDSQVTFEGTCNRTHRCFIKRQYAVADAYRKLGRALMTDIFVTGFEKIPLWSIVSDWFFTITPFLKALEFNPKYIQEKSLYSVKVEIHGFVKLSKTIQGETLNTSIRVDLDTYDRKLLNPKGHLGIYWNPSLSWRRQIDAIAFLWSKQRRIYKNYYMT